MNANTKKQLPILALFFSAGFFIDSIKPISAEVIIRYQRDHSDNEGYDRRNVDNNAHHHHRRHQNQQQNIPRSRYRSATPQVPGVRSRLLLIDKNRSINNAQQRYLEQKFYRQRRIENYYQQQNRFNHSHDDHHRGRSYTGHD